jgi:hypothetical protein
MNTPAYKEGRQQAHLDVAQYGLGYATKFIRATDSTFGNDWFVMGYRSVVSRES